MAFELGSLGSILGGVGQLAGGVGGFFSGGGANLNAMHQNFADQMFENWSMLAEQERFQKEMAQNSILYRVNDAKQAGVSPLVALGAPTFSAPVTVGGGGGDGPIYDSGSNIGPSLQKMGAGLGDILSKSMTDQDRKAAMVNDIITQQRIKSNDIDLQIKAAQLAKIRMSMQLPGAADVGSGSVVTVPDKVVSAQPGRPDVTAGVHPDSARLQGQSGNYLSPTDPAVINNPSITNPFMLRWLWNQYVGAVDRNVTNPLRRMMGLPDYVRGQ